MQVLFLVQSKMARGMHAEFRGWLIPVDVHLFQVVCNLNSLSEQEVKSIDISLDKQNNDDWWTQMPLSKLFLGTSPRMLSH